MDISKLDPVGYIQPENEERFPENTIYYVFFWKKIEDGDDYYYLRFSYRVSNAKNVLDVIDWEKRNAEGRQSATMIPVKNRLHLLHGEYPIGPEVESGAGFGWTMFSSD